jgi:hypothetical protein
MYVLIAFLVLEFSSYSNPLGIYAEVEIPVASNLRLLSNKSLVTFNLMSITVSSDNEVYYFTLGLK